jgi:hypothetical protein
VDFIHSVILVFLKTHLSISLVWAPVFGFNPMSEPVFSVGSFIYGDWDILLMNEYTVAEYFFGQSLADFSRPADCVVRTIYPNPPVALFLCEARNIFSAITARYGANFLLKPAEVSCAITNNEGGILDSLGGVWVKNAAVLDRVISNLGVCGGLASYIGIADRRNNWAMLDDGLISKYITEPITRNSGVTGSSSIFFLSQLQTTRLLLKQYYSLLGNLDYLNDWRDLKLEREIWRSADDLATARKHWLLRKRYYASFYEPTSLINKVSIWMPNHLIPGWAFITPYTSRLRYTALGKVDVALIVALLASVGSVFSSINYVITYRYIGAPTLKNRKELRSFFVDALLVGSRMMILANPAFIIGILLLLSDRHLHTSVFDFSGGGDTILFQHLF